MDLQAQEELRRDYEEWLWLRHLTLATMPAKVREAFSEGDLKKAHRELAIAFLAGCFEEAMAGSGFVSSPELQADGSVKLLWHKPGAEGRGRESN